MPLQEYLTGHFVLKCPNYHGVDYLPPTIIALDPVTGKPIPPMTTMEELLGWQLLPRAVELTSGLRYEPAVPALAHQPVQGLPVRLFMCRECGYIEMYSGTVVDPKRWPSDGS